MMLHRLLLAGLCAALALPLTSGSALAQLAFDTGDALVLDLTGGRIIGVKLEDGAGWSAGDQFVVPSGGPLDFPRGLTIASQSDGALFVNVYNEVVRVEDEDDRQDLVTVFSAGPPLLLPRGITFDDSEEDLFVPLTDFDFISWILRVDRITGIQTTVSKGLVYPRGIALDPSDPTKLLVADSQVLGGDGLGVYRVDPEAYDPSEPLDNVTLISQHGEFSFPNRLAAIDDPTAVCDPPFPDDGLSIYVTDPGLGGDPPKVVRVQRDLANPPDCPFQQEIVASGGFLLYPLGIAIDSNGDLLVSDADAQAIVRIDLSEPDLEANQTIVSPRPGSGNLFDTPWGIQIVPDLFSPSRGNLLVTDTGASPSETGVFRVFPSTSSREDVATGSDFSRPTGAVVDHVTGELVVVDAGNQTVYRVDSSTTNSKTLIASGGFLVAPSNVVVEADGSYVVTDPEAKALIRIFPGIPYDPGDPTSNQEVVSPNGASESFFKRPMATEIDDLGQLVVADAGDPDVADDGRLIEVNPLAGQQWCISQGALLEEVTGVTRDEDGSFVFAGRSATPVVRLAASGFRVESESSEYQSAGGVAIDLNRDILVIDAGDPDTPGDGRVLRLDPLESEPSVVNGSENLSDPVGIALDAATEQPAAFEAPVDYDSDGVGDDYDNCIWDPNLGQEDENDNGFGDVCDPPLLCDCDGNNGVGVTDFNIMTSEWLSTTLPLQCDCNGDGGVGLPDFAILVAEWGQTRGPAGPLSGLDPRGPCLDPPPDP